MTTRFLPPLLFAVCCALSAHADVVTLSALHDTSLAEQNPTFSDGAGAGLFSGTDGNNKKHRALISFDLSSLAGATISNVQLNLTLANVAGGSPGTATIGLFAVTQNWGQGTAGKSTLLGGPSAGIGGSGQGFAGSTGDATWSSAFLNQTLWTAAGGDHAASASASLNLSGTTTGASYSWLSTTQLVADVQGWVNNPTTNFGWELINANEATANSLYGFYSSDWHTFPSGNASQEPSLVVTFMTPVPEPAVGLLLGIAMFSLLPLRRRV